MTTSEDKDIPPREDGAKRDEPAEDAEREGDRGASEAKGDDDASGAEEDAPGDEGGAGEEAAAARRPPRAKGVTALPRAGGLGARAARFVFWLVWFVSAPGVFAALVVWALSPPSGVEHGGPLGWIESIVREQPVPAAIVIFTIAEAAIWNFRRRLPLARFAYTPIRKDVPNELREAFERGLLLLEEADSLVKANGRAIKRDLSAKERARLDASLAALAAEMTADRFDRDAFLDALADADKHVERDLGRWRKSEAREYFESILLAVAVALLLRTFVVEAFKIPSGSMIPTLQVGDHIFVNKFSYGPAIPFTRSRMWTNMPPRRGDVMVFAYPEHPEQDFIKRVIAVPGDKLEARGGHPWINGWEVPHCEVGPYAYDEDGGFASHHEGDLFVEFLGDEAYLTLYDKLGGFPDIQGPYTCGANEAWVMGDNRNNSHDSRAWFGGQGGGVPFENIRGRALFVWLSVVGGGIDWTRLGAPVMGRPRLPAAMKGLEPAIEKCMRERPPQGKTQPPPPR